MSNGARVLDFEHAHRLDRDVSYLGRARFALWLRNTSGTTVHVRSVAVRLQADDLSLSDDALLVSKQDGLDMRLEPGARGSVELVIVPPLIALGWSNSLTVSAEFESITDGRIGAPRFESREQFGYLIIREAPAHESAEVFVSFLDHENEALGDLAEMYLQRAGMRPYLAKRDTRTGCDYWKDKIYPAIERSCGVLVVWSADAVRRPENVVREMEHAQSVGVPVGLFLERGAKPPRLYPQAIKEYAAFDNSSPRVAFARAIAVGADRWAKIGRFFD